MYSLKAFSRIMLLISGAALLIVLIVPMWRIELDAPQYPEGLMLLIYANKLGGSVDIINGLNHYIGMRTLHDKDFVEFAVLPWIIVFFSSIFILVSILNKRKWLNLLFVLFVCFGVLAMVDFWRWEYSYGHDLNPDAAIRIPGMAYQPPLIGFKQLLNFGAFSVPDTGGWIFIGAGAVLLSLVIYEQRRLKKFKLNSGTLNFFFFALLLISATSCNAGPESIKIGKDNCYFCKMTISDIRFGAELVTVKGKIYKFDDTQCLLSFLQSKILDKQEVKEIYLSNYSADHSLIPVKQAFLLTSEQFRSPMHGNIAAFSLEENSNQIAAQLNASKVNWDQLTK